MTRGARSAGRTETLVEIGIATFTGETRLADAVVAISQVLTGATVLARVTQTLIQVNIAVVPGVSRTAGARVHVIFVATSSMQAGVAGTLVQI